MLGQGGADPAIGEMIEGGDLQVMGGAKTLNALALMYRQDSLDDPLDLAGKTLLVESAYEQQTVQLIFDVAGVTEDDLTLQQADPSAAYSLLARGEADAIWGTMGNIPPAQRALEETDVELGATALNAHMPIYGYITYVNGEFYNNNPEYTQRVLAGYSHALGWVMLNPREAVEFMRQDVNQALQTQEVETQMEVVKVALIASNLTEEAESRGIGALTEDKLQSTFDNLTNALDLGDSPPSTDDFYARELNQNADLRQFSSSEWDTAVENAQPYVDLYQGRSNSV
jgi:ABC-type nitrate/sulfonate/bicarbonate transport system substrate-binding protein